MNKHDRSITREEKAETSKTSASASLKRWNRIAYAFGIVMCIYGSLAHWNPEIIRILFMFGGLVLIYFGAENE